MSPVQVFPSLSSGDTELSEAQEVSTSVSVISALSPVQTAVAITASLPLTPVLPVLSAPIQTSQPEVEELLPFTYFLLIDQFCMF